MDLIIKIIILAWVAVGTFFFVVGALCRNPNGRTVLDNLNDTIANTEAFHGRESVVRPIIIILVFLLVVATWPGHLVVYLKRRRADGT